MHVVLISFLAAGLLHNGAFASALTPEQRAQIVANVEFYDELVSCAAKPSFSKYGLSKNGPCGDWDERIAKQQSKDLLVIRAGYSCLSGDIRMAGVSMLRPNDKSNREHLAWVKAHVDECREALKG